MTKYKDDWLIHVWLGPVHCEGKNWKLGAINWLTESILLNKHSGDEVDKPVILAKISTGNYQACYTRLCAFRRKSG